MSDDQQRVAEALDPDVLGDDPTGDLTFPPDRPVGADDPTHDDRATDDAATRAWRSRRESDASGDEGLRLVAPNDVLDDDVAEAVAAGAPADDLSAEEAAVHPIDEPR